MSDPPWGVAVQWGVAVLVMASGEEIIVYYSASYYGIWEDGHWHEFVGGVLTRKFPFIPHRRACVPIRVNCHYVVRAYVPYSDDDLRRAELWAD